MQHKNYIEIKADSNYDFGLQKGKLFKNYIEEAIEEEKESSEWEEKFQLSRQYIDISRETFPHLIEEIEGCAIGADVSFDDLWVLSLDDELDEVEKCTTIVTNNGKLIAHNEDWDIDCKDDICILKKTIKGLTTLEFLYYETLGGNSISINSHGIVQSINTLTHSDKKEKGIPRNITARWLSETASPDNDFDKLVTLQRASGYNHNFADINGNIWNIESNAGQQIIYKPYPPYVHTNHCLTNLMKLDVEDNEYGSFGRYDVAIKNTKSQMTVAEMQDLMSTGDIKKQRTIFNKHTIARMIIDLDKQKSYIWLLRENDKGWLEYNLDFLPQIGNIES